VYRIFFALLSIPPEDSYCKAFTFFSLPYSSSVLSQSPVAEWTLLRCWFSPLLRMFWSSRTILPSESERDASFFPFRSLFAPPQFFLFAETSLFRRTAISGQGVGKTPKLPCRKMGRNRCWITVGPLFTPPFPPRFSSFLSFAPELLCGHLATPITIVLFSWLPSLLVPRFFSFYSNHASLSANGPSPPFLFPP